MILRLLLLLPLLSSCASTGNEGHIEKSPNEKLAEKRKLYCELAANRIQERGYAVSECDGLLFTSLWAIGCSGDISAFESGVEPGRFYRDPTDHDCFIPDKVGEQGSDSTISKDMYVGLSAYIAAKKDKDMASRVVKYGEQNNWIVGEAKDEVTLLSKCLITPPLQNVFRKLAEQSLVPQEDDFVVGINKGFQAHLDVLSILVRGKIDGQISNYQLAVLKEQAKRQPRNALFAAARAKYDDGDFGQAYAVLTDESLFPAEQLPNNHQNYCTDYLFQRDESDHDWKPCPDEQFSVHDGTEFIFATAVITGAL